MPQRATALSSQSKCPAIRPKDKAARRAVALVAGALAITGSLASAATDPDQIIKERVAAAAQPLLASLGSMDEPGCVTGAELDGRTVFVGAHGSASMDHSIPLSDKSVLQSGSVAKQVTAFAVTLLAERGALSLDDPLTKHLPRFDFGRPVTLRQLINHTSGVRDQEAMLMFAGWRTDDPVDSDDVLRLLERQKSLGFEPGTRHVYSNSGYILLAEVVKQVSGSSLAEFAQREIFAPLGMQDTTIVDDYMLILPHRAMGYLPRYEGGWAAVPSTLATAGSSNLYTTVPDMLRWMSNMHSPRVGIEAVKMMAQPAVLADGEATQYGGGVYVSKYRGTPALVHGGVVRGFVAEVLVLPDLKFGAVALCNRWQADAAGLVRRLADAAVPDGLAPRRQAAIASPATASPQATPAQPAASIPAGVPGLYRNIESGALRKVVLADGQLKWGPSGVALVPLGNGLYDFGPGSGQMRWTPATTARGALFEVLSNGAASSTVERLPDFAITTKAFEEYSGEYYSAELDTVYSVTANGHEVQLAGSHLVLIHGSPLYRDGFQLDLADALLEFRRDKRGKLIGFDIGTERTPAMRFVRKD